MAQTALAQLQNDSVPSRWSVAARIAFRFCFIYFILYCLLTQIIGGLFPIPNLDIPDPGTLSPMQQIIFWVASHVFHAKLPLVYTGSGSGDKTFDWIQACCFLAFALVATAVWSLLDRKRENYITLLKWFRLFIRFALAGQMFLYGMVKAVPLQMPFPYLAQLLKPFGQLSPMGVLWSSVGAAPAYETLTGCAEILGGILLVIPRTVLLGSLVCLIDVTLIFALNMTYDVPVKLFSFHLILMALFLLAPECKRLTDFFVRNRAVEPSTQPTLFASRRANKIALAVQLAFGIALLVNNAYNARTAWNTYGGGRPKSPLYGIWSIEELYTDGPPVSNEQRLRRAIFNFPNNMAFQRMDDSFVYYGAHINAKDKTIGLTTAGAHASKSTLSFQRLPNSQMILDGDMDNQKTHMRLRLVDISKFTLLSRGFHWIQEYPFNR